MSNCDEKQMKTTENALFLSMLLHIYVQYLHQSLLDIWKCKTKIEALLPL